MEKLKTKWHAFRCKGVIAIAFIYALIACVLFVELKGVQFRYAQSTLDFLPKDQVVTKAQAYSALEKNTLLLYNSKEQASTNAYEQFEVMLCDMKVGTEKVDLSFFEVPELRDYSSAIILLSDLSALGDQLVDICQWVYEGGNVMFPLTLEKNVYSSAIENKIGIVAGVGYTRADSIYVNPDFMAGGGKAFLIEDAYDSARTVQLSPKTTRVHAAVGDADGVPLIWEADYGEGEFVVVNFGMCDKAYRGFFAAALSLFDPVYVYPVINGSTFYLDDFPSQIPSGINEYIMRDYNTTTHDFYINIWWPDMMNLADKYGIKYTGLAIECYDDAVDGTTDAAPDTVTFMTLGNMLLRMGGELGYHGYNHQPLGISRDYQGIFNYKSWDNEKAIVEAFNHLVEFCDTLFPEVPMTVYVPPSNLLTDEGKDILMKEFEQIRTYSGIYLPDDVLNFTLLQEYDVDENGVVDQPRIISGCDLDDFMTVAAMSELNMHYVNNHFTHPDDALDPDRGAELGWAEMCKRFEGYLRWLYSSAPGIRNFTGSEFSAAVQRFAAIVPHIETDDDSMCITLENFFDNAQLMVRFNEEQPDHVTGGKLTWLTGDLYVLEATQDTVTIDFK